MKTTVTRYLIVFLLLASLPGLAQFGQKPKAPVLPFRIDNTNSLNFLISSAGKPVVPTSTLSIWAEIRLYDAAPDTVRTVTLTRPANSTLAVLGILPQLEPGRYSVNLLFRYSDGQGDFRSGVCYIDMAPSGSIIATPDATGLNVTLNQTTQVLEVKLDATPSAAIAKSYADQVRSDVQIVLAAVNSATGVAADAVQANQAADRADSAAAVSTDNRAATLAYRNQTQVLKDSASIYRNHAATSHTNALQSENTTKGYRDATLTTYQSATTTAKQVQDNATTVGASTTLVQELAAQVRQDRDTVAVKTAQAKQSASRASTSEQNSLVSENNAANSASQANQSKVSAGNSQTAAAASAGTATTQAGIATQKAGEAVTSAGQSTTNLNGAILARQGAEAARDQGQVYADSAGRSRTQAATSRTNALASENAAKGYRDESQVFRNEALAYRNTTVSAVQNFTINLGNISTSATIDMSQAANTFVYGTLVGNTTLTITGVQPGRSLYLELIQGGAGGYTATFPSSVRFPAGSAVDWNTTAGLYNAFSLVGRPSQGGFTLTGFYSKQ